MTVVKVALNVVQWLFKVTLSVFLSTATVAGVVDKASSEQFCGWLSIIVLKKQSFVSNKGIKTDTL